MLRRIILRIWAVTPSLLGTPFLGISGLYQALLVLSAREIRRKQLFSHIFRWWFIYYRNNPWQRVTSIYEKVIERSESICLWEVRIFFLNFSIFLLFVTPYIVKHVFLIFIWLLTSFSSACFFSVILTHGSIYFHNVNNMFHYMPILFSNTLCIIYSLFG